MPVMRPVTAPIQLEEFVFEGDGEPLHQVLDLDVIVFRDTEHATDDGQRQFHAVVGLELGAAVGLESVDQLTCCGLDFGVHGLEVPRTRLWSAPVFISTNSVAPLQYGC